ncbi:hypothetical protein NQ314_019890 [Rhamnusium bicolor]|uniref:Methyltransferase type 11 domain-containing protein n=1 Tax=Rhamnusium bicolor TaxID=1586634 RepID=A0AAV8WMA6_9CUCU|nr:hypothetical protein NQ314_019890 [Rhamnusium bicolor]
MKNTYAFFLPRRSLAVISGESRYDWTHGITPRKFDVICSENCYTSLERGTRISLTFRKILQGECKCKFKQKCESYNRNLTERKIEDTTAFELEKLHVHEVYENIASHFSDTRHKPWPNVLEFIKSFNVGSILVDIGCGNGKYLGCNKNIFNIGCDRSFGLIDVCKQKGFEALNGDCLNIPLKDYVADGAISIAVIHHLANEDRRLCAIKEMVRILKIGGLALIYVWAKDQHKDKQKSSYIKQDRKNRKFSEGDVVEPSDKNNRGVTLFQGVSLPIHTNRTQFKHSDLLVPWKLKSESDYENTFFKVLSCV